MRGLLLSALLLSAGQLPAQQPNSVAGLPIKVVPADHPGHHLAILLTGDGNWADIDQSIARGLAAAGVPVVGLEARAWMTNGPAKTAAIAGTDVGRIAATFLARWGADSLIVIGYSRGAEFAPFAVNRLPDSLRARVSQVVMLGPSMTANWTFHLVDLIKNSVRPDDVAILPEVERLVHVPVTCVYGSDEVATSLCPHLTGPLVRSVAKGGGHHFDKDYAALVQLVLERMRGK
jgi:type IV secretory pathway VirJ component